MSIMLIAWWRRYGMAWLLITHEMGLAARVCDRLVVMSEGRVQDGGASVQDANGVLVAATEVRIVG